MPSITYNAKIDGLFHLDLAYAPPFSIAKDFVHYTNMILDNDINGARALVPPSNLDTLGDDVQTIDVRSSDDFYEKFHLEGSQNIPHEKLRDKQSQLDKIKPTVTYCNKGITGNATQIILIGNNFENIYKQQQLGRQKTKLY